MRIHDLEKTIGRITEFLGPEPVALYSKVSSRAMTAV